MQAGREDPPVPVATLTTGGVAAGFENRASGWASRRRQSRSKRIRRLNEYAVCVPIHMGWGWASRRRYFRRLPGMPPAVSIMPIGFDGWAL